jgi:signal transduction histidine kinase
MANFGFSIKYKLGFLIGVILILTTPIFSYISIKLYERALKNSTFLMRDEQRRELDKNIKTTIANFHLITQEAVLKNDYEFLRKIFYKTLKEKREIIYGIIINTDLKVIADTRSKKFDYFINDKENYDTSLVNDFTLIKRKQYDTEDILDASLPIFVSDKIWGTIRIVYTTKYINQIITQSFIFHENYKRKLYIYGLVLTILFIGLGLTIASLGSKIITGPISKMMQVITEIGKGNLEVKMPVDSKDEFGILSLTFNKMVLDLANSKNKILDYQKNLEKRIEEKTKEIREIQDEYMMKDRISSLGKVVAGVCHALNNPLNFIYGNFFSLKEYVSNYQKMVEMYEKNLKETSYNDVKKFKQELDFDFIKKDIDDIIESCSKGIERSIKLLSDLKLFSESGSMKDAKDININELLEFVIKLLAPKISENIELKKILKAKNKIYGNRSNLNEVFVNIIENAIESINKTRDKKGTIEVSTRNEDGSIFVTIKDNGVGIKDEDVDKIFDPFWGTKDFSSGRGLGLSLTYGIIKRHNGELVVEKNESGGVTFTVKLPLQNK